MSPSTPIRLVALDLDGTLLDSQSQISPRTRQAIADAVGRGVIVLPCTGRPLASLPPLVAQLPGIRYAITTNGAAVWDMGTDPLGAVYSRYSDAIQRPTHEPVLLERHCLPPETAREVFALYREYHGPLSIFSDGRSYLDGTGMALFQNRHIQRHSTEARQPDDGRTHVVRDLDEWMSRHAHEVEKQCLFFAEQDQVPQALARFREIPPDLVFMDIEMPGMNGFEVVRQIRAFEATRQWAWTPIIFLTATNTPENLVAAIDAGGDAFIAKSVPAAVFEAKMKAMARIAALRAELSRANRKLANLANLDGLTGLFNRRYMDQRLDELWSILGNEGAPLGLLLVDVDHFKQYNDCYGHLPGDDALRQVAGALARIVEGANAEGLREAFVARYGGEEFSVILPRCPAKAFPRIAEALRAGVVGLAIPHESNEPWGRITLSVGGAYQPRAEGALAQLFRKADAKLYEAKRDGRNRVELAMA